MYLKFLLQCELKYLTKSISGNIFIVLISGRIFFINISCDKLQSEAQSRIWQKLWAIRRQYNPHRFELGFCRGKYITSTLATFFESWIKRLWIQMWRDSSIPNGSQTQILRKYFIHVFKQNLRVDLFLFCDGQNPFQQERGKLVTNVGQFGQTWKCSQFDREN